MMDLEALLRAARDSEPRAWQALLPPLFAALRRYFGREFDDVEAVELSQRTVTAIVRQLPGFEFRGTLTNWVYGVARNQALVEHRTRRRQAALRDAVALVAPRSTTSPTSRVHAQELLAIALEELAKLPPYYRRAIENDLKGGDIESLAKREGIPRSTARVRRFRAIERLRRLVAARMPPPTPPPAAASSPSSTPQP